MRALWRNRTEVQAISMEIANAIDDVVSAINVPPFQTAGVLFPAIAAPSLNANTLDDYRESTWTPRDESGVGLPLTLGTCQYVKLGQLVLATFDITYPATASGSSLIVSGLPFTSQKTLVDSWSVCVSFTNSGLAFTGMVRSNTTQFRFFTNAGVSLTNAQMSTFNVRGTAIYRASA